MVNKNQSLCFIMGCSPFPSLEGHSGHNLEAHRPLLKQADVVPAGLPEDAGTVVPWQVPTSAVFKWVIAREVGHLGLKPGFV